MSQDLELALRIRADVQQAVRELKSLRSDIAGLRGSGSQAARGLDRVRSSTDRLAGSMRTLRRTAVAVFAAVEVTRWIRELRDANLEMQRIHYTLEAVAGSSAGAAKEFAFIRELSQKLGLDLKSTAAGYSRLAVSAKSAGVSQDELHHSFVGLADAFTVLHTPAQDVNGLLVQLEQGMSLGKLQMQDFRAIAQHMPGTFELVDKAVQNMGGSLQQMLKDGGVPAKQFFIEFTNLLREKYGPEAQRAAHGMNAELNRLHNTIFGLQSQKSGFVESFTEAVRTLNKTLNDPSVQEGLKNLIKGLGDATAEAAKAASYLGSLAHLFHVHSERGKPVSQRTDIALLEQDLSKLEQREKSLREQIKQTSDATNQQTRANSALARRAGQEVAAQLDQNQTLQRAIRARLSLLKHEAKVKRDAAKHGTGGSDTSGTDAANRFLQNTADLKVARAAAEARIKLAKDAAAEEQRVLQRELDDGRISYRKYYAEVVRFQQAAIDKQIANLQKEVATEQAAAKADTKGNKKEESLARIKSLEAEITILRRKRHEVSLQASHEEAKAEKNLADQMASVRAQLLAAQGKAVEARRVELTQQYAELIKRLTAEGDQAGIDIVNHLIDMEAAKTRLGQLQAQFGVTVKGIVQNLRDIKKQNAGGLFESKAAAAQIDAQVTAAQRAYNDELARYQRLLDENKISQDAYNKAVADARGSFERVKQAAKDALGKANQYAIQGARNIQNSLADFLFDPFKGGVTGMVQGFTDALRRMAAEAAAAQLGKKLFGDYGTTGKVGGLAGGLINAIVKHGGGTVSAAGVTRSVSPLAFAGAPRLHTGTFPGLRADEVPVIMQQGEGVLSRQQMQQMRDNPPAAAKPGVTLQFNVNAIDAKSFLDHVDGVKQEMSLLITETIQRYNLGAP